MMNVVVDMIYGDAMHVYLGPTRHDTNTNLLYILDLQQHIHVGGHYYLHAHTFPVKPKARVPVEGAKAINLPQPILDTIDDGTDRRTTEGCNSAICSRQQAIVQHMGKDAFKWSTSDNIICS